MGLFNFGKKKEEKVPACACQCGCPTEELDEPKLVKEVCDAANGTMTIKVLGAGCASCHTLLENTQTAVAALGLGGVCNRYGEDCRVRRHECTSSGDQ